MKYKILENVSDNILPNWDIKLDLKIKSYLDIFATNVNINEMDMLEIIEYDILCELSSFYEYSEIYMIFSFYKRKYMYEHISAFAGLFLGDMIDFYIIDDTTQPTLSNYKECKYQSWVYFRDNFIYKERFNADNFCDTTWDTPQYWSKFNLNATITQKGEKYFNEILSPRFYEKYKDLEVEIDDKGQILAWYKNGVRIKSSK